MKSDVTSALVAFIIEGYLIFVFVNEAFKLAGSNTDANLVVLVLSAIGIVGIASLAIRLLK